MMSGVDVPLLHARRSRLNAAQLLTVCLLLAFTTNVYADRAKSIFGWVEEVRIDSAELSLRAKLDTGATTSSLNAQDIEHFERDGKEACDTERPFANLEIPGWTRLRVATN